MTTKQRQVLSNFVDKFREALPEVVPDHSGSDKEYKNFFMSREQLEDFAYRVMKVALEKL